MASTSTTAAAPVAAGAPGSALQFAKGALRRLALAKLEPTPANFARAYAEESGAADVAEAAPPARARPVIERLAARASDDASLRGEIAAALLGGRWDDLKRALDRDSGAAPTQAKVWAELIGKLAHALERGSRQWTPARKKDSLQRVLDGSRSDAQRLQQRLGQLVAAWQGDNADNDIEVPPQGQPDPTPMAPPAPRAATERVAAAIATSPPTDATARPEAAAARVTSTASMAIAASAAAVAPAAAAVPAAPASAVSPASAAPAAALATVAGSAAGATLAVGVVPAAPAVVGRSPRIVAELEGALRAGLPADEPRAVELADELALLAARLHAEGESAELVDAVAAACQRARRLFGQRHQLVDELMALCRSLTDGLTELAEDDSWAQGQSRSLRERLTGSVGARAVHAAGELLAETRQRQHALRAERARARDALKAVIQHMLGELGELGAQTGRFNANVARYADVIESADSLDSLAGVVREMVGETRAVHDLVAGTRDRLAAEHARAGELEGRVRELETELRRLSDEVSTDALTQVANRRGLAQMFEAESARIERGAPGLAVGLLDIDNFKKLNDSLGHAAGDVALKSLAARVKEWLRPVDHLARFGGEEFVVLLPCTPLDEAQQVLTRLQRRLSASLFMHDGKEVFVTFSAGVTLYRPGEPLEVALERADEGLYEAKRTGKNRTCMA